MCYITDESIRLAQGCEATSNNTPKNGEWWLVKTEKYGERIMYFRDKWYNAKQHPNVDYPADKCTPIERVYLASDLNPFEDG